MSYRGEKHLWTKSKHLSTEGGHFDTQRSEATQEDIKQLFLEVLNKGTHGFCFSLYEEGQKPGDPISEEQIRRRLSILKPYTKWIRTFSCTDGNELIPPLAKEMGIKTLVGAWLGDDPDINEREISGLLDLAKKGLVDVAAVGNEVLYRKDLTVAELMDFIKKVKSEIPDIPVGYVDAYYEFTDHPEITELCDVILCNCYPYWEGCPFEYALDHMNAMYNQALEAGQGKKVIITETGWPSKGESLKGAHASQRAFMLNFVNAQLWATQNDVEVFYFSSFDESWKVGAEGEVGAYWGIWDKNEQLKI
ncbi:MAG: glycosyl hydrolase [Saprospiraceae bacterium]|nr:glycosyl hydrolase [Saprospiraceae bacterium]